MAHSPQLGNTRFRWLRVVFTCFILACSSGNGATVEKWEWNEEHLKWSSLPPLPDGLGIAGAYIGSSGGTIMLAGGRRVVPGPAGAGESRYLDAIYVLDWNSGGEARWSEVGRLPQALADGASVSTAGGLLCLGGRNEEGAYSDVFLLQWREGEGIVEVVPFPSLPLTCSQASAAELGGTVYVAGGMHESRALHNFWSLDIATKEAGGLSTWRERAPWPGAPRWGANLIRQNSGGHDSLFLIGGQGNDGVATDAFRYDLQRKSDRQAWRTIMRPPRAVVGAPAAAWGAAHILVVGGIPDASAGDAVGAFADLLAYHTITDTWVKTGALGFPISQTEAVRHDLGFIIPGGIREGGVSSNQVNQVTLVSHAGGRLHVVDYAVLFAYLGVMVVIGIYFSRREGTTRDYLLGGQRIPFWAAGLSLMATSVSSIGFMAMPAKAFATNLVYFTGVATWFVVVPLVVWSVIPFYRKLNVTSAFEYLEVRFNLVARLLAALIFCGFQVFGRIGVVLYIPSLALATMTGMDPVTCILLMGVLSIVYTVMGGIEAVIWTDVMQAAVLFGGGLVLLILCLLGTEGGLAGFLEVGRQDAKFTFAMVEWDHTAPVIWIILVANVVDRFMAHTADQTAVQRYQSTPTAADAKKALWLDAAVSIPWACIVFGLGIALYAFYKSNPADLDPNLPVDSVVPLFITQHVPIGLSGLIIAAIFAASMSSLDSSIHSVATILVCDFYDRLRPGSTEAFRLGMARVLTAVLGIAGTAVAIWMASLDLRSIWDLFLTIASLCLGPQAGLFVLGIFSSRANAAGAVTGFFGSSIILYFVRTYTDAHFFLYSTIGLGSCIVVGYLASWVLPGKPKAAGLTIYSIDRSTL